MLSIKLAFLVSHVNCLDGNSCMAIESNVPNGSHINFKTQLNQKTPFSNYWAFDYLIYFASFFFQIKFVFMDIISTDIKYLLDFYKNTTIKFEIYDHHYTQQKLVDTLVNYPNLLIDFRPKSKYGATKQLVEKYKDFLTVQQINFFTKIAACDMWNKEAFPDFNYFTFGMNKFKYNYNIKNIKPDILWEISFDGDAYIEMFVESGKKFYDEFETNFNKISDDPIKYEHYNILLINTSKFKEPYNKMNMVSTICFYFQENKIDNINTLGIYNDNSDYISLRCVNLKQDVSVLTDLNKIYDDYSTQLEVDVSILAEKCDGGGHKKASGCKLNLFLNLIKQ